MQREALVGPVGKEVDQLPGVEQFLDAQRLDLRDARARDAGAKDRAGIGQQQPARGRHLDRLAAAAELPGEGLAGQRIAHLDADMSGELGRLRGPAVAREVAGRGHGRDAGLDQLARHQRGGRRRAEAQRDVEALAHQVAELVARDELERELRMPLDEAVDVRRQQQPRGEGVDVDAQPALHRARGAAGARHRVLDAEHQRIDAGVELAALVGQAQRARGAVEQPHADARLEPRDGPAHARGRDAQRIGRLGEAAAVDDGGEHADVGKQSSVESHGFIRDLESRMI